MVCREGPRTPSSLGEQKLSSGPVWVFGAGKVSAQIWGQGLRGLFETRWVETAG